MHAQKPLFPSMRSKQGKLWGLLMCAGVALLLLTLFVEELPVRREAWLTLRRPAVLLTTYQGTATASTTERRAPTPSFADEREETLTERCGRGAGGGGDGGV